MKRSSLLTSRGVCLLLLLLLAPLLPALHQPGSAQSPDLPGVRGWFYESPTYGWSMIIDPAIWLVEDAGSANGFDTLTITGWSGDTNVVLAFVETYSAPRAEIEQCLDIYEELLLETWPEATFTRAVFEDTGRVAYGYAGPGALWLAAYHVENLPGMPGQHVIEVHCTPVPGVESGIIAIVALMPTAYYHLGADYIDALRFYSPGPDSTRTGEARPNGAPPRIGVLEFGRFGLIPNVLNIPPGGLETYSGVYLPPSDPLPPGKVYVMTYGWVGNVDGIASMVDLSRFVAGKGTLTQTGAWLRDPGLPSYAPSAYLWLWGATVEDSPVAILPPGETAAYVVWFVVDVLPEWGYQVWYESPFAPAASADSTTNTDAEEHVIYDRPCEGCAGGGARPRIRIGD